MKAGSIYVVTNKLNGHQYVGLTTKTVAHRWSEHKTSAVMGCKTYLYSALRKYGPEVFEVQEYFAVFNVEELSSIEREVIQALCPAYNQTNGGEHTRGRKHSPEAIERIRAKNIGIKRTEAQKEVQRRISKERWDSNPEFREQCLAAAAKGRANIDQTKRIEAVRASASGREWTEASRAKLSASCMGRRYGPEVIERMAATKRKAVKCNETGEIFSCREEAAKKTGVSERTIFRDVRNEDRKPAKGRLTFSYI